MKRRGSSVSEPPVGIVFVDSGNSVLLCEGEGESHEGEIPND
jgi:hypothetical protein